MAWKPEKKQKKNPAGCAGKVNRVEEIYEKRHGRLIPPNFNYVMRSREKGVRGRERGVWGVQGRVRREGREKKAKG